MVTHDLITQPRYQLCPVAYHIPTSPETLEVDSRPSAWPGLYSEFAFSSERALLQHVAGFAF